MFETRTCLIARCNHCGDIFEHDYVPHFDSETEALEVLRLHDDYWIVTDADETFCSAGCRDDHAAPAVVPPHTHDCALVASDGNAPCDCRATPAAAPAVLPPTPTAGSNSGGGDPA